MNIIVVSIGKQIERIAMSKTDETVTFKRQTLRTVGWVAGGVIALGATFIAGSAFAHVMGEPRGGDTALGNHGDHGAPGQMGENFHPGDGDGEVNDGPDDQNQGGDGDGESNDDAGEGAPGMTAPSAPAAPQDKPANP
jgi:hypothetical protein